MNAAGRKYQCAACQVVVVVTQGGEGEMASCGSPMGEVSKGGATTAGISSGKRMGKRYRCSVCATEAMIVSDGLGDLSCCGQDMDMSAPRQIPSAD